MTRWTWCDKVPLIVLVFVATVFAGNTNCIGNQLDWYTNVVGETPCMTYQRLRQICNTQYQVPVFRPNTPGDNCDDQLDACCCNSISWSLSMLCMNCQAFQEPNGIDAGATAYNLYRMRDGHYCSPGTNQTLPGNIQTAVCNANIRLDNFLYELFWNTGDWFYEYTREYAQEKHVENNNNVFTHCANQISPSATATPQSTSQPSGSTGTSNPSNPSSSNRPNSSGSPPVITGSHSPSSGASVSRTSLPTTSSAVLSNGTAPANVRSNIQVVAIGSGIGGGLALLAIFVILLFCYRRRNAKQLRTGTLVNSLMASVSPFVTSDDGTSNTYVYYDQKSGIRGVSKRERPSFGIVPSSSDPSNLQVTGSVSPPSSSNASGHAISSQLPNNAVPERHEDGGAVLIPLERSASGRLPPAYMSWGSVRRTRSDLVQVVDAAEIPVRPLPDLPDINE